MQDRFSLSLSDRSIDAENWKLAHAQRDIKYCFTLKLDYSSKTASFLVDIWYRYLGIIVFVCRSLLVHFNYYSIIFKIVFFIDKIENGRNDLWLTKWFTWLDKINEKNCDSLSRYIWLWPMNLDSVKHFISVWTMHFNRSHSIYYLILCWRLRVPL